MNWSFNIFIILRCDMHAALVIKYIIDGVDTGYCVNSIGEMFTKNRTSHSWCLYKGTSNKSGIVYRRDRLSAHFQTINKEGSITQHELMDYYYSMSPKTTPFEIQYENRVWKARTKSSATPKVKVRYKPSTPKNQEQPVVDLIKPKMLLLEGKPTNLYVQKDGYLCFWIKKELRIIPPYNGTSDLYYTVSVLVPKEPLLHKTKDPIIQNGRIYVEELKRWYNSDASFGLPVSKNNCIQPTQTTPCKPLSPIIALVGDVAHVFKDVDKLKEYLKTVPCVGEMNVAVFSNTGNVIVTATTSDNTINVKLTTPHIDTAGSNNKIVVFIDNVLCRMVDDRNEAYEVLRKVHISTPVEAKLFMNNMSTIVATMTITPPTGCNHLKFKPIGA